MKKYSICFVALYCLCFAMMYLSYPEQVDEEPEIVILTKAAEILQAEETTLSPVAASVETTAEPEAVTDNTAAAPPYFVKSGGSEILVYYPDEATLYKRIPLVPEDLSESDRISLEEGLSFETIDELYHYLESITS